MACSPMHVLSVPDILFALQSQKAGKVADCGRHHSSNRAEGKACSERCCHDSGRASTLQAVCCGAAMSAVGDVCSWATPRRCKLQAQQKGIHGCSSLLRSHLVLRESMTQGASNSLSCHQEPPARHSTGQQGMNSELYNSETLTYTTSINSSRCRQMHK